MSGDQVSTTKTSNDCEDLFDGPASNSQEFKFASTLPNPEEPRGALDDNNLAENTKPPISDASGKMDNIDAPSNVNKDINKEDDDGNVSDGSLIHFPFKPVKMSLHRRLEAKLNSIEKMGPPIDDEIADKKPARVKAIPELNEVEWDEFKNLRWRKDEKDEKDATPRTHYAIDVLRGNPVLYHQHRKSGKASKANDSTSVEHMEGSKETKGTIKDIPERIRINSVPLIRILSNVASGGWAADNRPIVVLRPFKPLIYQQDSLYSILRELEAQWGSLADQEIISTAAETESNLIGGHKQNQPSTGISQTHGPIVDTDVSGENTERSSEAKSEDKEGDTCDEKEDLANSVEALKDLRCLMKFIGETLKPHKDKFQSFTPESENIRFQDLWYLFRPGQYVYAKKSIQKVWRVLQATGGRPYLMDDDDSYGDDKPGFKVKKTSPFALDCYCFDFDGTHLGPTHKVFKVQDFEGYKKTSSLALYPLEFSRDQDKISKILTEQGEDFIKYMKISKRWYKGRTQVLTSSDKKLPVS